MSASSSSGGASTVNEYVETDRTLAKSRSRSVIAQCPELALIGITPDTTTSAALIPAASASAAAVSHGCFTTTRTSDARRGSFITTLHLERAAPAARRRSARGRRAGRLLLRPAA